MSRYIVDISGVGPSRYDFYKRKSFERKIRKNRPISAILGDISPIYRLWPDISESKSIKVAVMQKNAKKKTKKNHFGRYIDRDIS